MNGDFIRKKIEESGFQLVEVARRMKISPQDLQSKLKSKDIKVSFLLNIAQSINKNLYYFFETKGENFVTDENSNNNGNNNSNIPNVNKLLPTEATSKEKPLLDDKIFMPPDLFTSYDQEFQKLESEIKFLKQENSFLIENKRLLEDKIGLLEGYVKILEYKASGKQTG